MGLKDHVMGQCALIAYMVSTQAVGVNFFQLQPEHRAFWLVGAVLVLAGLCVTARGRHSPGRR